MPELPEVQATARLLSEALQGATVESARAPGINALRSVAPPLSALAGRKLRGVERRGKLLLVLLEGELVVLVHLMSAGACSCLTGPPRRAIAAHACWWRWTTAASCACGSSAPASEPG